MSFKISPLAPKKKVNLNKLNGINVSITHCGLKKNKKEDLVLIKFDNSSCIFWFFTKSKTPGEPIIWNKSIQKYSRVSAILINSGNANVFTGDEGKDAVKKIVDSLSKKLGIKKEEIYLASTGIIGEKLDHRKIIKKIPYLISNLSNTPLSWQRAANAIRTTDTYEKLASLKSTSDPKFILNGIAKGSGMIAPNMGTMLSFIFTDFQIQGIHYKKIISGLVERTFNSITVDGDTSTSDMVLLVSVKQNKTQKKINKKKNIEQFFQSLEDLMRNLSQQIVKDGEGASKFIQIKVSGTKNYSEAKKIAFSIANSPLFKTALSGSDLNWGRIIMAIGKANINIETNNLTLKFGNYFILKKGRYVLKSFLKVNKYIKQKEIDLSLDFGVSQASACVWTCDFTKDYISINTDYKS